MSALRTIVLVTSAAVAVSSPALAASTDPATDCYLLARSFDQVVVATRSCSDAVHLRRSVDEADSICSAARALSDVAWKKWEAIAAGTPDAKFDQLCPAAVPAAQRLVSAKEFQLAWGQYRLNGQTPPPPFKISVPKFD